MKRIVFLLLLLPIITHARAENFRFAQLSDIHLSPKSTHALEDLKRSIDEIAADTSIAFVIASGDLTEAGDRRCLELLKNELDRLPMPYFVTSGNHETTWSESACTAFDKVFGSSRFAFSWQDCFFIGFNSGPFLKMMDGHVAPQDIEWLKSTLDSLKRVAPDMKIFPVTHYPLQDGDVDNWYDVTDVLRQYNIQAILGGHYHRNLLYSADGIPNVLGRSNLHGKDSVGGYTIIAISPDSIRWSEKVIGKKAVQWLALPFGPKAYPEAVAERPSFAVNETYPEVEERWQKKSGVAILEAPALGKTALFYGDDNGTFYALDRMTGQTVWMYQTGSRIKSAPAVYDGRVVFGSTDGNIYCLSENNGKLLWKVGTGDVVMGCPVISEVAGTLAVLIGGSDHVFRAIELKTGREIWRYTGVDGYVVTRPCVYMGKVIFGAWDCGLYALNLKDGTRAWRWSNGSANDKFSPATVWPVATHGRVFIVAPDRVFTCIDAASGRTIYRTKEHKVRESIGLSADGTTIFSRCMWDTIIAMDARSQKPLTIWKTDGEYGYDHNPSMMIEKDGVIIFGTKNGLLHGVAAKDMRYRGIKVKAGTVLWRHKIGNSVLNTICPVSAYECYVTSTDGSVTHIVINE